MVLLKTTVSGIALVALGILLVTVIGQFVTVEVQDVKRRDVEPHAEFLVGDVAERSYTLPGGVSVSGSVDATQASTNQSSDIRFMVFDDENYQKWNTAGQANFMFSAEKQGHLNFTFSADRTGVYHFVFDNRASLFKKYIALSIGYDEVISSRIPDTRTRYLGWAVLVAGAVIVFIGLIKKTPVPWA